MPIMWVRDNVRVGLMVRVSHSARVTVYSAMVSFIYIDLVDTVTATSAYLKLSVLGVV